MKSKRILKRTLRTLAIVVTVPLALIILLTAVPFAASIGMKTEPLPADATNTLKRAVVGERWMTGVGRLLDGLTRTPKSIPDAANYQSEHFYPGGAGAGEAWRLGYAQAVITPEDWETRTYYMGGNISVPARKITGKLDDLKVRVIAISDGGGVNVFAAVDSIGVTNRQVLQIRALVADMGFQSVNIASTHVHSAVDSTGIYSKGGKVDEDYLAFVNERVAGAIREAVAAMEPGRLYFSTMGQHRMWVDFYSGIYESIGWDLENDDWYDWDDEMDRKWEAAMETVTIEEYGMGNYTGNRRGWQLEPSKFNKLRFAPDNPDSKETLLLNFAAHPFYGGWKRADWPADNISGDFVYYMEELINEAGANMIFVNGAVNGINPNKGAVPNTNSGEEWDAFWAEPDKNHGWLVRAFGRDFAGLALAMTMPPEEIAGNKQTNPDNEHGKEYRFIIEIMQRGSTVAETELHPRLDIRLREVRVDIENPLIRWTAKRDMLNMNVLRDGKILLGVTEIGLLELGGEITVALLPGEFTPGLAWRGGDTTAAYAIRQRDFAYPTFSESAGREVLVFGLCNDEIGYVIPDNDYVMFYADNLANKLLDTWGYDHYAELLSPGPGAAGVFARAFEELAK